MTQRKALVVDDSKSARFALRRFLEGREFDVDTAESADEAYKYLAQQLPAVIFLDHSMPGTDGFDVLREIKGDPRTDSIPVVICSSNEAEDFQSQAVERGAAGVLPKPPTATQLERILGGLQAFAQQLREDHAPDSERVTTLHRAADQVQAEQAIESAVLRVVNGAVPQNGESLDERLDSLSTQIARRLNHVGDTVSQQMTALRERLDKLEQGNGATPDSIRDLAREETDALRMTLQKQLSELRDEIAELRKDAASDRARELQQLREEFEALRDNMQGHNEELLQAARATAAKEAATVASRTVVSAASKIADRLAESIMKALARQP